MVVRFSKHALQRCRKRFGSGMHQLLKLVECEAFDVEGAKKGVNGRLIVEGFIGRRGVRVVLAQEQNECLVIVTVMWL